MKAVLMFDLSNEQDAENFETVSDAQDYKDAFQETFKYVRDQLAYYSEGHTLGWVEAFQEIKEKISEIAKENEVSVW
jgi:hypothetical protein